MNRILILRHVESEANRDGVGLGRADSAPTERGLRQLRATVDALAAEPVVRVLSSPLSRARLLAEAIAESHGLAAESRDELLELDVGELEGVAWPVVRERYADFLESWRGPESVHTPMPGGESMLDVLTRAAPLFDQVAAEPSAGAAVLVSHNFVVKMLAVHALQMPHDAWRRLDTGLAGVSAFRVADGLPILERFNDCAHVAEI